MGISPRLAKKDPRTTKVPIDGKVYFSYADIHDTVSNLVPKIKEFNPSVIIAIGGGGFVPARILRTELRIPILAVSLELYDDATNTARSCVRKIQWFDEDESKIRVRDRRVLIVDEVDDTRQTLQYCVEEVIQTNRPAKVAVAVVHNKLKPKRGALPENVVYMAGADVEDHWNCYPWDAAAYGHTIYEHEALANKCTINDDSGGSRRERNDEIPETI